MIHKFEIRKFTQSGLEAFKSLLTTRPTKFYQQLLTLAESEVHTVRLGEEFEWDDKKRTRGELASQLWSVFGQGAPLEREAADTQVWNWLACRLFPLLQVEDEKVVRSQTKESVVRWIMTEGKLRQHRHLISGPFVAYKNNFPELEAAQSQLVQPILEPGEVVERIAGKLELSQGSVALLTTWLYVDPIANKIRSGITGEGEPQQLSKYFNQIQKTVDYESMTAKDLLGMLPKKFDKWRTLAKQDYKI